MSVFLWTESLFVAAASGGFSLNLFPHEPDGKDNGN